MAIRAVERERSAVLVVKKREKEATLQLKLKRSTEVCPSGTPPLPAVGGGSGVISTLALSLSCLHTKNHQPFLATSLLINFVFLLQHDISNASSHHPCHPE